MLLEDGFFIWKGFFHVNIYVPIFFLWFMLNDSIYYVYLMHAVKIG